MTTIERARAYLRKVPGAVEGNKGDQLTFSVACYLIIDFCLPLETSLPLFEEWNEKCSPPWTRDDLIEKLNRAEKYGKGRRGSKESYSGGHNAGTNTEPIPLFRKLEDAKPYPIDSLGALLTPVAKCLIRNVKAPDAICAQSLLAAAALAVQGFRNVLIDGRTIPLSLFLVTIAESGERKSFIDRIALALHREIEKILCVKYQSEFEEYKKKQEVYEAKKREILGKSKKKKTREEIEKEIDALGTPPPLPIFPLIIAEDPTVEGLFLQLSLGWPSMGVFSDEGGQLIGGYGLTNDNKLKTISGLSKYWDGDAQSRVRAKDGSKKNYGKRVSMHIMAPPSVAHLLVENPLARDQGLLSRVLVCQPQSTAGDRVYTSIDISTLPEVAAYNEKLRAILRSPLPLAEGTLNELEPSPLILSKLAHERFIAFYNEIETQLKSGGRLAPLRGFGSKAPEHALRIAGVIQLIGNLGSPEITEENMRNGISIVEFNISEALRLLHGSQTDPDLISANTLLSWLRDRDRLHISLIEIYQMGPNSLRDANTARKLMKILENHGYVTPIKGGMEIDGKKRREVWKTNEG